jgi:hypothetical protein
VQLIITGLGEAVRKKDKITGITKMVLNETKWLLEFIGRSKSQHLTQIVFGSSAMGLVNSCKIYIQMLLRPQTHIFNPMRGSSFQIITFIGLTASREKNHSP